MTDALPVPKNSRPWQKADKVRAGQVHAGRFGGMQYTMSQHWGEPSRVGSIPHRRKGGSGRV
jgi:hypothetical protein